MGGECVLKAAMFMAAFLTHLRNVGHMTGDKLTELWTRISKRFVFS